MKKRLGMVQFNIKEVLEVFYLAMKYFITRKFKKFSN